jgi:hypothetical protein
MSGNLEFECFNAGLVKSHDESIGLVAYECGVNQPSRRTWKSAGRGTLRRYFFARSGPIARREISCFSAPMGYEIA